MLNISQPREKSSFKKYVILGTLAILLAVTNPNEEDVANYLAEKTNENKLMVKLSLSLVGLERNDYIFFSKFSFNQDGEKKEVIGLFKKLFFKL
ncbi:hypothetical protein PAECIP111893_02344 [Paenibacillus plantiphilus]|uniref:Uncharacterized protein n=1 Tax=Paenibacillus plantiphilus TaxID=2905650 RepID=A0ABN8GIP6_9BACL|nr:hypothetical protein PAECIP111893_02344 [Paenibacillus plantiphilus]